MKSSPRRGWTIAAMVVITLSLLTLGFQAVYVFLPEANVIRPDGYDSHAHFWYYYWVSRHPDNPLAFHGTYTWIHFPSFYQWNTLVRDGFCWFVGEGCEILGLKVAWFSQAVLRVGTLWVLFATYRRLFRSAEVAGAALILCATSPRVFFTTCIWNQDDYVFFFAVICMYVVVASVQDGLTTRRMAIGAVAAALGFHVKLTFVVPIAAMLVTLLLLPRARASLVRKAAVVGLVAAAMLMVNWTIFTTPDGFIRVIWRWGTYHEQSNSEDLVRAYLSLNPGPIFRPERIIDPVSVDWKERNSAATVMYLYLFELYEEFQGPPRTWLNLLCVWTGTPLLALMLWRTGRTLLGLVHPATVALDEVYCAMLLVLSFCALFYYSLSLPFGWFPHPEYILPAYPAAAVLVLRELFALKRPVLFRGLAVVAIVHVIANIGLIVRTAVYKIAIAV